MNVINRQTVVAALIGMSVPILCILAINLYGRSSGVQARAVSETRIVPSADVPAAGAPAHACPDMASASTGAPSLAAPGTGAPASLVWQAPAGWTDAGTKGLRLANFVIGPAGEAECYVTVLGGEVVLVDLEGTYGGPRRELAGRRPS